MSRVRTAVSGGLRKTGVLGGVRRTAAAARARRSDESGIVIIFFALCVTALVTMIALVVDISQARTDRRANKALADFAARAGVGQVNMGPWQGVCKARDYLLGNSFKTFDTSSEKWSTAATPPLAFSSSPCTSTTTAPYTSACTPNEPSTWARLRATAGGGRITVTIQSGYALPDAGFPSDMAGLPDAGDPAQGSCDNLAVILTEHRNPLFGRVVRAGGITTKIRSVARLNTTVNEDYIPSLLLLERHKCNVLQTGGANTRVIAQPFNTYPGVIQIDSAGNSGSCPSPILNAQATSTGPSVVACSANSTVAGCDPGTGTRQSRVGIYALNLNGPPGNISTAFPSSYGDTVAKASPRSGRKRIDMTYRQNLLALDASAKSVVTGNAGMPPGCTTIVNNACTALGRTWLVLQPSDCTILSAFFGVPERSSAQNIWFNCDLNVNAPLSLTGVNSYVVVTGQLAVNEAFTITDPRSVYIGGRSTGNKIGLDVGGSSSVLNVNLGAGPDCAARAGSNRTTTLIVGAGSLNVASGATLRLCQTFTYLASGWDKLPATDGTLPCATPCSSYSGTMNIGSNAFVDWSAPNQIVGRKAEPGEISGDKAFEDLALWMEAGGNSNQLTGGSSTSMAGVFFMGNADAFNLAGNGSLPVKLSAQFVSTSMKVTGGAVVKLVPNPFDSVPVILYSILLVR